MAERPLREDSLPPLGGQRPASFLQDLLADFDPGPDDPSFSDIWGPMEGELATAEEGSSAEAQMVPLATTGEKQWTAAMQEAVCTMHEQWRGEPEGSVGPETAYARGQRAGENPAQPTLQDGAIGAQEAAGAETSVAEWQGSGGAAHAMPAVEARSMRERNRVAQRRYRIKKRDRLVAAEEKVAQLTSQLEAAHLEQSALVAELASRPEAEDRGGNDGKEDMSWLDEVSRSRLAQHDLVCTLPSSPMTLTFHELTRLPDEEVATLRVRYTIAFAECLLAMQGDETHPANARLVELAQEFSILWQGVCTKSPDELRRLWGVINRMAGQDTQPDAWHSSVDYTQLAHDANLTPGQIKLALDLRAVYLRNYSRIRHARMGLSGTVTQDGIHGRFDEVSAGSCAVGNPGVLDQSRRLLRAEHCQFVEVVQLLWHRVLTPLQCAFLNVRAFPACVSALKFAEAVATNAGQPAHTEVVAAATAESVATGATGITPLESVLPRELPGTGEGC